MPFYTDNKRVLRIEGIEVSAAGQGLGFYPVQFRMVMTADALPKEWSAGRCAVTGGDIFLVDRSGGETIVGRLVTRMAPTAAVLTRQEIRAFADLILDLSPERLEQLEQRRAGGDIKFKVKIRGWASGSDGMRWDCDDAEDVRLSQSEWTDILAQLGYRKTLLIEVPILTAEFDNDLAAAGKYITEARDEYMTGRYRKVIEACRQALEAAGNALGDGIGDKVDLRKMIDGSGKATKDERLMIIRRALYVMACLAVHAKDDVSLSTTWEREDALAMITMTAGALQWIARSRATT